MNLLFISVLIELGIATLAHILHIICIDTLQNLVFDAFFEFHLFYFALGSDDIF